MLDKIDNRWQEYNSKLDRVDITNIHEAIRNGYIIRTVSGNEGVAMIEIRRIRNIIPDNPSVIEIGGGYGGYCKEFHRDRKVKDYTIVDTKSMLRFAKAYLEAKGIKCTFLDTEEELPDREYDLLISNVCLSEIPEEHAKQMLTKLLKQVKRVAIMDVEMKWLEKLLINEFGDYSKDSCTECGQSNHYLYMGKKL